MEVVSTGFGRCPWLRLIVAGVVLLSAAGVIFALRPRSAPEGQPKAPGPGPWEPWFEARRQQWRTYEYVDLADGTAVGEVVAGWMRGRSFDVQFDKALLTSEIVRFLQSLAAPDADAYLRAVRGRRELRTDIADDAFVQACYHEMTGRTLGMNAEPRAVLREFWCGHAASVLRPPVSVSKQGYLDVARCRALTSCAPPPSGNNVFAAVCPAYSVYKTQDFLQSWSPPSVSALTRLTRPRPSLEEVLRKHDTTLTAVFGCVVKAVDGTCGIFRVDMYFCPDEGMWQVEVVSTGFGRCPLWPM